ncbi:enoyl-CoA hydratase/isomerase family protein [Micromonospora sp. Llam7]|uniref:enoyl-CoA-hydratase DpgB n=1 Tax=Micromonospora tarapacensis TaxID=2835305 RepID=UPI001C8397E7|nr:enoyl-CoA hydratase/isomerase family protein [Micromonospora tarapacensis]
MEGSADTYVSISAASLPALVHELAAGCDRADAAGPDSVLLVHLHGGATGDGTGWPGDVGIHEVTRWERTLRRLERLAGPSVAVAEGDCVGPAMEVLLSTDYRIATGDLRLRPSAPRGTPWPGMAIHRLVHQIGVARARRLVLFGEEIDAATAAELGLVDDITDDIAQSVRTVADALRTRGGTDLPIRRRLLLDAAATTFEDALGAHLAACDRHLRTARTEVMP